MQKLDQHIHALNTDEFHAISVINLDNGMPLGKDMTGKHLVEKYGSVKAFFENLKERNIKSVKIFSKRKNGSAWKASNKVGDFILNIGDSKEEAAKLPVQANTNQGLNGGVGLLGLSALDIMDMRSENLLLKNMQSENIELKSENKIQAETIKRLEREALERQFTRETSDAKTEMYTKAMSFGEALLGKVAELGLLGGGLKGGADGNNLSESHQKLIAFVKGLDEPSVKVIQMITNKFNNEEFENELLDLLKKHA